MVTINYPGSLDSFPEPDETTYRDDPGFELDVLMAKALAAAEALEAKLGVGATTPDAIHKTFKAIAAGESSWGYHTRVKLDEIVVTVAQASLDFTSINQNFRSLHVVIQARGTTAATTTVLVVRINNDSGSNYDYQSLTGNVSSASSAETFGQTIISLGSMPAASAGASLASHTRVEFANYTGTTFNKTVLSEHANKVGTASGNIVRSDVSGFWRSTAAITRLTFTPGAGNFEVGTVATLYGEP